MVRIRLTIRECELLRECFQQVKGSDFYAKAGIVFEIDDKELNNVIDAISTQFSKRGLAKNGEPNNLGVELENLNDKFVQKL